LTLKALHNTPWRTTHHLTEVNASVASGINLARGYERTIISTVSVSVYITCHEGRDRSAGGGSCPKDQRNPSENFPRCLDLKLVPVIQWTGTPFEPERIPECIGIPSASENPAPKP